MKPSDYKDCRAQTYHSKKITAGFQAKYHSKKSLPDFRQNQPKNINGKGQQRRLVRLR